MKHYIKSWNVSKEDLETPGVKTNTNTGELHLQTPEKVKKQLSTAELFTLVHFITALTPCPRSDFTTVRWSASQLPSKQLGTVVITLAWKGIAGFGVDRQAEAFSPKVPVGGQSGQRCLENIWPTQSFPLVACITELSADLWKPPETHSKSIFCSFSEKGYMRHLSI